ncbi:unnamed protein product [Parascedosporium putredinis]|uniref:FF domain-containing protein n=1 Tax=Parascedosporium putredinis TaxID=1442378 RepID=A0A9P1MCE6_9PEZI|nr:unnamed protein product [Parascedosporium putredinis]CAI7997708.1 unnamed protein product [Parascedosporium putredinis]
MAGQAGSTPQELFWDVVEDEERGLRSTRNDVLDVLDDKRFEVTQKTSFDEFLPIVKDDRRTANIDPDMLRLIFERIQEKSAKKPDDDRHAERQQRRAAENLRSYIKHLDPLLPFKTPVASEDARRAVFDKVIRRLREREEDTERDRHRRRDRGSVDRDAYRERDRSRGERSHRGSGRASRRSRTPEADAYEADRRKAIAERERNHRKATLAEGVSRREDDAHYERDRKSRDEERERVYRRRTERGGSYDELPYGDERPSTRRRRTEEDEDRRDSKPPKADSPAQPSKEDPGVHSGSEEGEIEED